MGDVGSVDMAASIYGDLFSSVCTVNNISGHTQLGKVGG